MMASRIVQEDEVDSKIKLFDIIRGMVTPKKKKIQIEELIVEASLDGMTETDVDRLLDKLKEDHMVYEPEPGYIQPAR